MRLLRGGCTYLHEVMMCDFFRNCSWCVCFSLIADRIIVLKEREADGDVVVIAAPSREGMTLKLINESTYTTFPRIQ